MFLVDWLTGSKTDERKFNSPITTFNPVYNAAKGVFENLNHIPLQTIGPHCTIIDYSFERALALREFSSEACRSQPGREVIANECQKIMQKPDENSKRLIAKLVFLADHALEETLEVLGKNQSIEKLFKKKFKKPFFLEDLLALQNSRSLEKTEKELVIAQALFTASGNLNIGLIDEIVNNTDLFSAKAEREDYENYILNVLYHLKRSPELQLKFDQISYLKEIPENCQTIIKATTKSSSVNSLVIKKAVLTALLSSLRQGPVGSCFATSIGIEIEHERLDFYLKDLIELVKTGKLTRKVDHQVEEFPFIMKIADSDLDHLIEIDSTGMASFGEHQVELSKVPGLINACQLMGIDQPERTLERLNFEGKTTPRGLIELIAKRQGRDSEIGLIGFSSLTNCCLQRMWENILADMSEGEKDSIMRGMILSCVEKATHPLLKGEQKVTKTFLETLNESFLLEFDPSIKLTTPANDGSSTEGGFVLYSKHPNTRQDTPEGFKNVVLSSLKVTQEKLSSELTTYKQHKKYRSTLKKVVDFIQNGDQFLQLTLWNFDDDNKKVLNPLQNWKSLTMTPWLSKMGDDPHILFQIYTQSTTPLVEKHLQPKSALDLFSFAVSRGRELEKKDHFLNSEDLEILYLTCVYGVHAFSFTPKHESFIDLIKSDLEPQKAIEERLLPEGKKIANAYIAADTKAKMIAPLIEKGYLPSNFSNDKTTVYTYAQEVIDSVVKTTQASRDQVIKVVTNLLMASLPEVQLRPLLDSAILGFDTNWFYEETGESLYFCAFFNPATNAIDLGITSNKKSLLIPEDHTPWLARAWEINDKRFKDVA